MEPDGTTVEEGLALHRAGRLPEAAAIYGRVVAGDPSNADALHYLGVVASQQGDQLRSVELIARAITLRPDAPKFHNNLGVALRELKRLPEAEAAFRSALALQPDFGDALGNLALLLDMLGRPADCVPLWRRLLAITPAFADGWNRLGVALQETGQLHDAVLAFKEVVRLAPSSHIGLANLAGALNDSMRHEEALAAAVECIRIAPSLAEGAANQVTALNGLHRNSEALAAARTMAQKHPQDAATYRCLGYALQLGGGFHEALTAYDKAIALDPAHAGTRFRRGMLRLLLGDLPNGWPDYEWRWKTPRFAAVAANRKASRWNGEPLHGRSILVHAEQGAGDTLQFMRYLPLVAERGGQVHFECQAGLLGLLRNVPGAAHVHTDNEPPTPCDFEISLMSLPALFATRADTIPPQATLSAESKPVAMSGSPKALKVGLVWAGNPNHSNDRNRSVELSLLEPLLDVSGVEFFSLQVGPRNSDRNRLKHPERLQDPPCRLEDYTATAGVMRRLDLVISVDTSAAHLAGVLGRPVWTLLPFVPDWRWLLDREDSPWYPTMRLFRQRRDGDWQEVVQRVCAELKILRDGKAR